MATKKAGGLGKDRNKGVYFRSLGFVCEEGRYKQPKFYLGRDQQEAERRNLRLEQLWRCVVQKWERGPALETTFMEEFVLWKKGERPAWNDLLLDAARAVARGETTYFVPRPTARHFNGRGEERFEPMMDTEYAEWLAQLNRDFPAVTFRAADEEAYAKAQAFYAGQFQDHHEQARRVASLLDAPVPEAPHERLHHALDAYIAELEKEAHLSQWNRVRVNQARRLRDRHDDIPLAALDIKKVEEMIAFWRNRPPVKTRDGKGVGGQMAYNTARNQIIQLRHFFKWLNRHPGYQWKRPDGYEDIRATPLVTAADKSYRLRTLHVETYTPEELAVLYAAASPLMRLFILLGLNCGFAAAESGTLEAAEIFLHKRHPEAGRYNISSGDQDSWIRRLRHKTEVYGEWKLWPHTVLGLRWAAERRRGIESQEKALIVTARGESYGRATRGGNKNSRVRNLWVSLIGRVVKAGHPGFRFLPFKQLRKTGGEMVRRFADGETQGIFLCHGRPVKTDQLADIYSSRPYYRVFEALDKIETYLAPLWAACPDPFGNRPKPRG
jgi:hypothetical protein